MASGLSPDFLHQIEESTNCPICIERLKDPCVLPCQHVYCRSCLRSYAKNKPEFSCPTCCRIVQLPPGGVSALPTALQILSILDILNRAAPLPESSPMSEDEESKEETCQEHGQAIQFYCRTCVSLICTTCQENAHRAHTLELPSETAERHSGVLKKYKEDMINYMAIYDTVLNDLTDELTQANAQRESSLNLLAENTQRLIARVQEGEHQLKSEINTAADEAVAEYEMLQTKMMSEKETLSVTVGEINSVINGRPPIEVIRARVKQNLTYQKILNQHQPPAALPKFNLNIELQPNEELLQVDSIGKVVHQLTRPRANVKPSAPPYSRERHRPRSMHDSLSPTPRSRGFQWTRPRSSADPQAYGSSQSSTSADPSANEMNQSRALIDPYEDSQSSTSVYGGSQARTPAELTRPPPPYEDVMEQQQWPAAPSVSLSAINFEQAIQFFLPWHPGGMCYTRDGNIVVCECVGRDVHVYSPEGLVMVKLSTPLRCEAWDVVCSHQHIYVSELFTQSVLVFAMDGALVRTIHVGFRGRAGLSLQQNFLYVTSSLENKLYMVQLQSQQPQAQVVVTQKQAGASLVKPEHVSVSSDGLVVSCKGSDCMLSLDRRHRPVFSYDFTDTDSEQYELHSPSGVGVDADGEIVIADTIGRKVCWLNKQGQIKATIPLEYPNSVALGPGNKLSVACGGQQAKVVTYG